MLQNPRKTLGFKKNMVYKIPPGGEVNHIQPVAYIQFIIYKAVKHMYWDLLVICIFGYFLCFSSSADFFFQKYLAGKPS